MLLTISTTQNPATDLGFLFHKHPDRVQVFEMTGGRTHIFYPEATEQRCTIALLLDIDAINLVRQLKAPSGNLALQHYVNDRLYVASSFMSHAISSVFASALNGKCEKRPELVEQKMPFEVCISVVKVKGGEGFLRTVFEPLGYEIEAKNYILDDVFTEWGQSNYFTLMLRNTLTVKELLSHLYVLLPVFDSEKHYYIGKDEVEKLLAKGEGWLLTHPHKEAIVKRYLRNIGSLTKLAMSQLIEVVEKSDDLEIEDDLNENLPPSVLATKEKRKNLHVQRLECALEVLIKSGASSVLDLGCGEGRLTQMLMKIGQFDKILGMDVAISELQKAKERLYYDTLPPRQKERIKLIQGSLTFRDKRLEGYDAAALIEVIEHLDLERLSSLERNVFEFAKPKTVVVTTPNGEYNINYDNLNPDHFRHDDHRFEWSRTEFKAWTSKICEKYGYSVAISGVGENDEIVGTPSQMAVFNLN
jgi:3' terminal RNA ribose 2'-O-methyltransferase Hen1